MNNPSQVKVENKLYKINTDFRVALECNKIAMDESIGDYERALAIIFKLFGEEGLACENQGKLLELGMKYLSFEKEAKQSTEKDKYELDFFKCERLIRSSFKYDYNYDPYEKEYLHWYDFYNDLENLSTSEFGNCCVLNRISSILHQDPKHIKDTNERQKLIDLKKELSEKYCIRKEKQTTEEQKESAKAFYKALGIEL